MPLKNYNKKTNGSKPAMIPAGLQDDYKATFETEAGQRVLKDMVELYINAPVRVPIMPGEPSIEMQAGSHNVVAFIIAMMGDD